MSTRKSSITAELKLSGQAAFKSGLRDIEGAAKKTGKTMQQVRPPDISLTPQFQYWEARKRGEKTLTAMMDAEAKKRLRNEQEAQKLDLASRRVHLSNIRNISSPTAGGKNAVARPSGGGAAYKAGIAYNAIQDAAQGGIAGVANNIPQIVQAVASSPSLKLLVAPVAAVFSTALAGASFYKNVYKNSDQQIENDFVKRRSENMAAARSRQYDRENAATLAGGAIGAEKAGNRQRGFIDTDADALDKARKETALAQERLDAERELARVKIDGIADAVEKSRESAAFEKRVLEEDHAARIKALEKEEEIALKAAQAASTAIREYQLSLDAIPATALSAQDRARKEEAEAGMAGALERKKAAGGALTDIRGEKAAEVSRGGIVGTRKEIIDRNQRTEEISATQQKSDEMERTFTEKEAADQKEVDEQADKMRRLHFMKRDADRALESDRKRKEEEKQATHDELSGDVAMSKMSPRKRAKAEEARAVKNDTDELVKQGFSKEEAAKMAADKAGLRKPDNGRIRGAGYKGDDSKRRSGLGSASYDGLAGLGGMQPGEDPMVGGTPNERKRIKGAGSKKETGDQEKQQGDSAKGIWNQILAGLKSVEKAIRDTGPSSNDRAKPISTTNR